MKHYIFFTALCGLILNETSKAADFLSAAPVPGTIVDVAAMPAGGSVAVGRFSGTQQFGSASLTAVGSHDSYVATFDKAGAVSWAVRIGATVTWASEALGGVDVDKAGNVFVTGTLFQTTTFNGTTGSTNLVASGNGDVFLVKYNPTGGLLWAKRFGGNHGAKADSGNGLVIDGEGNVYVAGVFANTAAFGALSVTARRNLRDLFLAKFSNEGVPQWVAQAGGTTGDNDTGRALAIDPDGNVVVGGEFAGTLSFGPQASPSKALTSVGNVSNLESDYFLAKYSSSGTLTWAVASGGSKMETIHGVAIDASGNVYAAGDYFGSLTVGGSAVTRQGNGLFLAKYSGTGEPRWVRHSSHINGSIARGVFASGDNTVYLAGDFNTAVTLEGRTLTGASSQALIAQYDADGQLLNTWQAGGPGWDTTASVAPINATSFLIGGSFQQTGDFGSTSLTAPSEDYSFISHFGMQVPIEQPRLTYQLREGKMELTWPTTPQFVLESASGLSSALPWLSLSDQPVTEGENSKASIPVTSSAAYFRLRRQ
ncbi:MAG TPA: SBBP repeat-containing protein [Methylomirabilota bacterium]|nr:SBBP repeat-containing protein [Methylomirabilota bacterium]